MASAFETVAVTHSPDKEKLIRKLGADHVVANGEELESAGGADVILATSNSYRASSDALKGIRPDGRLVLMGLSEEPFTVTTELLMQRARIIGSLQNGTEYLYEALDYAAKGKVKVFVPHTFPAEFKERAKQLGAEVVDAKEPREVCPGAWTTGVLTEPLPEHGLYLKTPQGLVVITGCAHPGITRITAASLVPAAGPGSVSATVD